MARHVLTAVGMMVALLLALGCDRTPTATETWTPADHAHPPDSVHGPEGGQVPVAPVDDGLTPEQRTARTVYLVACAGCHGAQGRGDGPDRAPIMRLPSFQSAAWQASLSDDQLVSIITLGRGMMPAFGERIPPEGVRGLVAHLRSMATPEPVEAPPAAPDGGLAEDGGVTAAPSPHGTLSATGEGVVE